MGADVSEGEGRSAERGGEGDEGVATGERGRVGIGTLGTVGAGSRDRHRATRGRRAAGTSARAEGGQRGARRRRHVQVTATRRARGASPREVASRTREDDERQSRPVRAGEVDGATWPRELAAIAYRGPRVSKQSDEERLIIFLDMNGHQLARRSLPRQYHVSDSRMTLFAKDIIDYC